MTDFLLELRSEEIPARMQDKALIALSGDLWRHLADAGLHERAEVVTYATPRRLTLIAKGLPVATAAVREEVKGPPADAPAQAIDGFLKKAGLTRDALETRDVKGRATLFAVIDKPGRATAEVLAEVIPAIVRAFPWPKSMRWGAASLSTESLKWVRPLQGIVALFGDEVVPCEVAGIVSGAATVGHRFHHPGVITIGNAQDYVEKLRACHVIVDHNERRAIIRTRAAALAAEAGLVLVEDEGLVAENAGLTEWPVPLIGRFDPDFLTVPPEVIQLTARVNQKYFVCRDHAGALANAFICTANIEPTDGGAKIVEGNRKVLAARLSDARFFYDTDLKVPLGDQAKKLDRIVFHEKLGTVADKVARVAKLARWLCEEGIVKSSPARGGGPPASSAGGGGGAPQATPSPAERPLHHLPEGANGPPPRAGEDLATLAERAAQLCKADLVTGMVGEFPELQGLIGGYYAAAQGEDPRVAAAIRDHYKPVGQGDDVPTDPVTVAVSLADKLDTLVGFFGIGEKPTGSRDPFALRRASLGILQLIQNNGLRVGLVKLADAAGGDHLPEWTARPEPKRSGSILSHNVLDFFGERIKVQQRERGVRHDLIDSVFTLGLLKHKPEDDLLRLLSSVYALDTFLSTEAGQNLLAGYKRATNILKRENWERIEMLAEAHDRDANSVMGYEKELLTFALSKLPYTPEPAEADLIAALDAAEPLATQAVAREDFAAAMTALASLRAPIDAFFTHVTVNDADPAKRAARLALLVRVRDAVHRVADFSKIEG